MKTEITKKTWSQISISDFLKLQDILNDDCPELDKNVQLISFFCDVTEDDVMNFDISIVTELLNQISEFFDNTPENINSNLKSLRIDDELYKVETDLNHFTYAQYIDFQTYIQGGDEKMAEVLSTFVIPKGKKYNEGYDVLETIETFKNKLDIVTARRMFNFFINSLLNSTKATMASLRVMMKKMMKKEKMPSQVIAQTEELMKQLETLAGSC